MLDRLRSFTPIGGYRDEFASEKTEIPEYGNCIWSTRTREQQIEAMTPLGAAGKENLRGKKEPTFVDDLGPPRGRWLRRLPDSLSRRVYAPERSTMVPLPICETHADRCLETGWEWHRNSKHIAGRNFAPRVRSNLSSRIHNGIRSGGVV